MLQVVGVLRRDSTALSLSIIPCHPCHSFSPSPCDSATSISLIFPPSHIASSFRSLPVLICALLRIVWVEGKESESRLIVVAATLSDKCFSQCLSLLVSILPSPVRLSPFLYVEVGNIHDIRPLTICDLFVFSYHLHSYSSLSDMSSFNRKSSWDWLATRNAHQLAVCHIY